MGQFHNDQRGLAALISLGQALFAILDNITDLNLSATLQNWGQVINH